MHHWKSFYKVWIDVLKNGKTCSLYAKDIFDIKRVQILFKEKLFSNLREKKNYKTNSQKAEHFKKNFPKVGT